MKDKYILDKKKHRYIVHLQKVVNAYAIMV